MIRDTVERSVLSPTETDLISIRSEAMQSVIRMGAAAHSVEVKVEVDSRLKRIVATASGSPEMRSRTLKAEALKDSELVALAAKSCRVKDTDVRCVGETEFLKVFRANVTETRLLGLVQSVLHPTRVIDREGIIRLKLSDALVRTESLASLPSALSQLIDELTTYGDAGALQPDVFVVALGRIIDLSGLMSKDQVLSLLRAETEHYRGGEPAVALIARKQL